MKQKGVVELQEELSAMGVNLVVKQCDISDRAQVQSLLSDCRSCLPPLKGVIHGAMALRDALFENITYEDWNLNIKPRVNGAWNLHHCLVETPLDFFLMLASGSGVMGNTGQAAYAASNTFLDSFCSYRLELGLPASVIDIGIVREVGYVAEKRGRGAEMPEYAHDSLSEAELLCLVKASINPSGAFQGIEAAQTHTGCKLVDGKPLPGWAADPRCRHILPEAKASASQQSDGGRSTVRELLKEATTQQAVVGHICESLRQSLTDLLMISGDDVDLKKPIMAYGLDSLVAVELRNSISKILEASVPMMELMNSPSLEHLAVAIARKSSLVDQSLLAEDATPQGEEQGMAAIM